MDIASVPKSTTIRFDEETRERLAGILKPGQTLHQFVESAAIEKISHMESRDKRSRLNLLKRDTEALGPAVHEILKNYGLIEDGDLEG